MKGVEFEIFISLILFTIFVYSKAGSNSKQIILGHDEVNFMFQLKKSHHPRFIDVEDGQFIEFRQAKESYYLETHQENQIQPIDTEISCVSLETEDSSLTVLKNKKGLFAFLFILLLMGFVIWNLSRVFWKETEVYLDTVGPTLVAESTASLNSTSSQGLSLSVSKANAVLGYFIHTQHGINALYEEAKSIVQNFSTGNLTYQEKVKKVELLMEALKEMETYNNSYLGIETNPTVKQYYQINQSRLSLLKDGLTQIQTVTYRSEAIALLNQSILEDQPVYQEQIDAFKQYLEEQQLNFYEKDGKLYFDFN